MSSNPPPPPPTTTSQSDSKTHISHEISPATPPIPPPQSDSETETLSKGWPDQETKDELFKKVMQEDWNAVISIYKAKRGIVSTAKITRNKETALHIAISDGKTEVVKVLLDIIDPIEIKEMTNDMDENPLHLAASLGQAETCKQLVEKDPELIGARNKEGETPLFQAALHGKKAAFYALHPKCTKTGKDIKHDIVRCKRTDGNSILHVAIQGEYFGLAYQIIYWYPELIKFYNERGLTALHLLAQNPSAFRSGCHLGPFDDFIYRCQVAPAGIAAPPAPAEETAPVPPGGLIEWNRRDTI
ncbi:serine/threonine-protein phosphatase 6 regulatory ankyrin repeat subunit B-like protein [Cinnamomum micranthum f. kanehirae]|uniref:Serine/threonine-protein phosphatase 6 regulatory ankyrin repeat subunit B-like protein n=1 Tax=Cinnamomum micranthum f. kanehirae TaxID=337451 RepID=A0A3S3MVK5_9MAGN|nr:serine/threonine-protein phosphatase 6 regulatory ankyrin repeat subunit B-like protein [Cinnamomum micranthum f. kanehirae]